MDGQEREFYKGVFDRVLNEVEPWKREPPPTAHVLAWVVAVSAVALLGNGVDCKALTKELEPIAQECLDKKI
jgi:hypothetical protein